MYLEKLSEEGFGRQTFKRMQYFAIIGRIAEKLMTPLSVLRHPFLFTGITVPEFLRWYFIGQPVKIMRAYVAYLKAFKDIFGFFFLIKTLFSPWKQITDVYPVNGFNFQKVAETFILNCLSRSVGCVIRLVAIAVGAASIVILTTVFGLYYMTWILFPVLFWIGVGHLLSVLF